MVAVISEARASASPMSAASATADPVAMTRPGLGMAVAVDASTVDAPADRPKTPTLPGMKAAPPIPVAPSPVTKPIGFTSKGRPTLRIAGDSSPPEPLANGDASKRPSSSSAASLTRTMPSSDGAAPGEGSKTQRMEAMPPVEKRAEGGVREASVVRSVPPPIPRSTSQRPALSVPPEEAARVKGPRLVGWLAVAMVALISVALFGRLQLLGTAPAASPPDAGASTAVSLSTAAPTGAAAPNVAGSSAPTAIVTAAPLPAPPPVLTVAPVEGVAPAVGAPRAPPAAPREPRSASHTPAAPAPAPAPVEEKPRAPSPEPPAAAPPKPSGNAVRDAQRALEAGDTSRAIDLARQAAAGNPRSAETWLTLGAAYEAAGRSALARGAYRSCVAKGQGDRVDECRALLAQ